MATVEMTVLMPILVIIIALSIYLGFYLYDRTALYCDSYLAAAAGVENPDYTYEDAAAEAAFEIGRRLENQLIASNQMLYEAGVSFKGVTVSYSGVVECPLSPMVFPLEGSITKEMHKPVTFIRNCRKIADLKENLTRDGK